jgi:hypothetical protein
MCVMEGLLLTSSGDLRIGSDVRAVRRSTSAGGDRSGPVEPSVEQVADAPSDPQGDRRTLALAGVVIGLGASMVLVGDGTLFAYLGVYLVSSVAGALLIVRLRLDKALPIAIAVGVLFLGLDALQRRDLDEPFHQRHDGAVVATEAAARMTAAGTNPYAADFLPVLSPGHHTLDAVNLPEPNPLVDHYPYLPAAFLVHVPFVELSDRTGEWYDARLLYAAIAAALVLVIATGAPPPFRRGAAVWALVGSAAVPVYLSWGANDVAAAGLVVIGATLATRRPMLAGVLLAVGVSFKAILVVALIPLVWLWWRTARRHLGPLLSAGLATGVLTCLPFVLASPRDFLDDTVLFNLGLSDHPFPVSGLGLGAHFPGVVHGWVLVALTVCFLAVASAVGIWWVRRQPFLEVALFAAGLIVLAVLLPARTFQQTYAPLMVILWAPIWRLPSDSVWTTLPEPQEPSG